MQSVGLPDAGADEDGLVAVPEQIVDADGPADGGVGPHLDVLQPQMAVFKIVQNAFGQPELGDSVPQNPADLVLALKDGHLIPLAGEDHRDGEPRRAGADDGHPHAVGGGGTLDHFGGIGAGNIVFDGGKMHRRSLAAQHAVALALVFVVAHQAAYGGEGVVFKQHPPGVVQMAVQQQPDHLRDGGVDGAPLLTLGHLAVQAAGGLVQDMLCHSSSPLLKLCNIDKKLTRYIVQFTIIVQQKPVGHKGKSSGQS